MNVWYNKYNFSRLYFTSLSALDRCNDPCDMELNETILFRKSEMFVNFITKWNRFYSFVKMPFRFHYTYSMYTLVMHSLMLYIGYLIDEETNENDL